jgi:ATP-dependent protease HslVU (ClpYQ) ATPase subunit
MAIKLAKEEVGVEESEEAIKALEEAMVQVAGKNKPSGAQVLAMVIVDHLIERDFFKPGIEKMKKQVIVDIQKVIMDSTF